MGFDTNTARQAGRKSSRTGKPNKAAADLRQVVTDLLEGNIEAITKDIQALEPKDRVTAWVKLLEFALPKLNRTQSELSGIDGGPIQICSIRFIDDVDDAQILESAPTAPR
jgi:hypothetical protein